MDVWSALRAASARNRPAIRRVLVITLGADTAYFQSLAAAEAIRKAHVGARITVLTTAPYKAFSEKCPFFDVVDADGRPRDTAATAQLIARIRAGRFDIVYDLQCSGRTNNYFHALRPKPPIWSGAAPGCAHFFEPPDRDHTHGLDRLAAQLAAAGVGPARPAAPGEAPPPDLCWVRAAFGDPPRLQPAYFGLSGRYVLLIPEGGPPMPDRRWPPERYAALARMIAQRGATPVVIGALSERDVGAAVVQAEPRAKNLVTRLDFFQVAALAERAAFAVGADTGLMHLAAAAGAPALVMFRTGVDRQALTPRGPRGVATINAAHLADLPAEDVDQAMRNLGAYGWAVPA